MTKLFIIASLLHDCYIIITFTIVTVLFTIITYYYIGYYCVLLQNHYHVLLIIRYHVLLIIT